VKIEGEYLFNGPRDEVWKIVRDPEVLATALPGAKSMKQIGEKEYEAEMNVRIGPVGGLFAGHIIVSDEVPPEKCTLTVEGKGGPGFANGAGHVTLVDLDDGTTMMKYEGDVQIGGKLASVGQRLLDTASKSMIRQGLETLNNALKARVATNTGKSDVDYKPPSETKFMAAVARDMAGQMLSSRAIWIAFTIFLVLAILIAIWIGLSVGG
jgi:carbon monoxide dehydrogenase subunit G